MHLLTQHPKPGHPTVCVHFHRCKSFLDQNNFGGQRAILEVVIALHTGLGLFSPERVKNVFAISHILGEAFPRPSASGDYHPQPLYHAACCKSHMIVAWSLLKGLLPSKFSIFAKPQSEPVDLYTPLWPYKPCCLNPEPQISLQIISLHPPQTLNPIA